MTTPKAKRSGNHAPAGKRQLNVYITFEVDALLKAILERDGVPFSAQIERAMRAWAAEKGIEVDHARKAAV